MTDTLTTWATKWGVDVRALRELPAALGGALAAPVVQGDARSESGVQSRIRVDAPGRGALMWRNNVGAATDATGRHIRYGLANDSVKVNREIKSSDLIGCCPVEVTPAMVGRVIGLFVAIECKRPGWTYHGTAREEAQSKFLKIIERMGGAACFATHESALEWVVNRATGRG